MLLGYISEMLSTQANEIIKKLQGDMKKLMEKMKLKNAVTMQQEKLLTEKEQMLQKETLELDNLKRALEQKEDEVKASLSVTYPSPRL